MIYLPQSYTKQHFLNFCLKVKKGKSWYRFSIEGLTTVTVHINLGKHKKGSKLLYWVKGPLHHGNIDLSKWGEGGEDEEMRSNAWRTGKCMFHSLILQFTHASWKFRITHFLHNLAKIRRMETNEMQKQQIGTQNKIISARKFLCECKTRIKK